MPNPWLNEHKYMAAMNYFLNIWFCWINVLFRKHWVYCKMNSDSLEEISICRRNSFFRLVWYQGFCSPYFTAKFRPHSQWKIGFFAPKICQIIPKLIGVIVSKNPDLVTISGNICLYYAITYSVFCVLFIHSVVVLFLHKHHRGLLRFFLSLDYSKKPQGRNLKCQIFIQHNIGTHLKPNKYIFDISIPFCHHLYLSATLK